MTELIALLTSVGGGWAYPAVAFFAFLESAAFVGLVIPGETAMLLGGVLAATSQVSLFGMIAGGVTGAVLGDLAGYGLGRLAGPSVQSGRMGRWVGGDRWDRAERLLERRGGPAVFLGRWVGVLRAVIPVAAGAVNMPARKFMIWNGFGGLMWASTVIVLGYLAGSSWQRVQNWLGAAALLVGLGGAVAAVVALGFTRSRKHETTEPASQDSDARPAPRPHRAIVVRSMVITVFALVIGELSDNVTDGKGITAIDGPVLNWMLGHRTADLTGVMVIVTDVGGTAVVSAVATVVAGWLAWRHRWHDALLVAGTTLGAGLLIGVLKPLVGRSRPPMVDQLVIETNQSYPSGHALAAAAVLGVLTVVLIRHLAGRVPRLLLTIAAATVTAAIGVSRLYLGVHWASDVIAGWLIGTFWLIICLTTAKVVTARLPVRAHQYPIT